MKDLFIIGLSCGIIGVAIVSISGLEPLSLIKRWEWWVLITIPVILYQLEKEAK